MTKKEKKRNDNWAHRRTYESIYKHPQALRKKMYFCILPINLGQNIAVVVGGGDASAQDDWQNMFSRQKNTCTPVVLEYKVKKNELSKRDVQG